MNLRIATCATLPEPDEDEAPLVAALAARGVTARLAAWDDPAENWDEPVPTVIRSTWNYIHRLPDFLAWVDRAAAAAPLWNPPDIVRGNAHKSYLAELEARGCPVVPTRFFHRGEPADVAAVGFDDLVVKPTVSASSFRTQRFRGKEQLAAAQAHLDALLVDRDAMVQRYVPSVEGYGERACVFIDGELTHCVRKTPRFSGHDETVGEALPIAADERAAARAALAPFADRLLYGRVDLARGEDGVPWVMELELIEPSLYIARHPPARERLVAALARLLRDPGTCHPEA
jgi:hypothetical protein